MEPVEQVLVRGPESLSPADLDRRDGDMDGVDEIRLEELPKSRDAASNPYVLPLSGVLGSPQRVRGDASRKWNVVSASVKVGR